VQLIRPIFMTGASERRPFDFQKRLFISKKRINHICLFAVIPIKEFQ